MRLVTKRYYPGVYTRGGLEQPASLAAWAGLAYLDVFVVVSGKRAPSSGSLHRVHRGEGLGTSLGTDWQMRDTGVACAGSESLGTWDLA